MVNTKISYYMIMKKFSLIYILKKEKAKDKEDFKPA